MIVYDDEMDYSKGVVCQIRCGDYYTTSLMRRRNNKKEIKKIKDQIREKLGLRSDFYIGYAYRYASINSNSIHYDVCYENTIICFYEITTKEMVYLKMRCRDYVTTDEGINFWLD